MSERIINFDEIRVGDKVEVIRKVGGTRMIGDITSTDGQNISFGGDIIISKYYCQPEVMLLDRKEREFEPGIYVSNEFADNPWGAIIWKLDKAGAWRSAGSAYSSPSEVYGAGWQDNLVRFVREVDAE